MKIGDVQKLRHGLYRVYWKSGGSSLASVGSFASGQRWFAPTNWISLVTEESAARLWKSIKRVESLEKPIEEERLRMSEQRDFSRTYVQCECGRHLDIKSISTDSDSDIIVEVERCSNCVEKAVEKIRDELKDDL